MSRKPRCSHKWRVTKQYSQKHYQEVCSKCDLVRRVTIIAPDLAHVFYPATGKAKRIHRSKL